MADRAGVCRYCGCTEAQACAGGCSWADETQTICSTCQVAAGIAGELVLLLTVVAAQPTLDLRVTTATWEALSLEQQRALVMTCRAAVEGIREAVIESLGADAIDAGLELQTLGNFLLEHCPDQVRDDDAISDVVIRLLAPHVGSRIVLP